MRECIEAYHEKRMRKLFEWSRAKILNSSFTGGTNNAVSYLSMTRPMIK